MTITTLGIDVGKNWFHVVGVNRGGRPVLRRKLRRTKLLELLGNQPPCLVGMEACSGSQHLARALVQLGHQLRVTPAQFVKPYVKSKERLNYSR